MSAHAERTPGWKLLVEVQADDGTIRQRVYLASFPDKEQIFNEMWERFKIDALAIKEAVEANESLLREHGVKANTIMLLWEMAPPGSSGN